jgi:hypothetical protein
MSSFERKENKADKKESLKDRTERFFNNFLNRSNEPGEFLTGEKKEKIIAEGRTNPEALKIFEKDKNSKYRTNSLSVIGWAEIFLLSDESSNVPADKKEELMKRIESDRQRIQKEK